MPSCEFRTALLCARAWMHTLFFIQLTLNLVLNVSGCAPQGITFPLLLMKQFDIVSGFDILTFA